ncbi:MAG: chromate transporter [Kiritimatiellae bacterium]|nr:chromate transporter [Kiritimatiellia bacterium]
MKKLARLFFEMFRVALFVVGGGYAIIAVCDDIFSKKLKWTEEGELIDMLPLYQMMPGILAAHNAVYVGRKVAGWTGSVVALAGVALPSIIVFSFVSAGYDSIPLHNPWLESAFTGLRAALTGVIAAMLIRTWRKSIPDASGFAIFAIALALLFTPHVPAAAVIAAALLGGIVAALVPGKGRAALSSPLAALLFLQYGAVAFGGGYVLVPVYIQDFVGENARYLQIPPSEFANLMALTQMTPGPIGINAATYFGYRLFGVAGGVVATACILVPGFILLSLALASLEKFRENHIVKSAMAWVRPVTAALMAAAVWSFLGMSVWDLDPSPHVSWCTVGSVNFNIAALATAIAAAALVLSKKCSIMTLVLASAAVGAALRA